MIKIEVIKNPASIPIEWDKYVENHTFGTIFHTRDWIDIIIDSYAFDFVGVIALDENNSIAGLLPAFIVYSFITGNRIISMPFSYICRPLCDDKRIEYYLIEQIEKIVADLKLNYYEIKSQNEISSIVNRYSSFRGYSTFILDIDRPKEELWASFHKSMIKRNIKKGVESGLVIKTDISEEGMNEFYRLNTITSRKNGIPSQPRLFFDNVLNKLISKNKSLLLLAYYGNVAVAGVVLFFFKNVSIYMYGASDPVYLKYRPNHLLLWEGILISQSKGIKMFDFGRVSKDNKGLSDFKRRWGTEEIQLHYYYWPQKGGIGSLNRKGNKIKIANSIISNLPLFIFKRISFIYRHLA